MNPKVTVVTPSYNQAEYLENTILSVLNQDYPNIEYVIIDGGSTDGSVDIIKRYQDRLAYWISEPDSGQSNAINKGFKHATGEIFNWLNSDDILMPSAVKIAVHYLLNKPEIGMVYGDRIIIDKKGNFLSLVEVPSFNAKSMMYNWTIPQETAFFRREHWFDVGGLDIGINYYLDYDLWCRLNKVTQIYHIPFVLGAYRTHDLAKTFQCRTFRKKESKEEKAKVVSRHFSRKVKRFEKKFYEKYNPLRLHFERESTSRRHEIDSILKIIS